MAPIRERSSSKSKSRSLSRKSLHDASEIETFGLRNVNSSTNTSLSKRAGLVMPVPAILKKLKKEKYAKKIQKGKFKNCLRNAEFGAILIANLFQAPEFTAHQWLNILSRNCWTWQATLPKTTRKSASLHVIFLSPFEAIQNWALCCLKWRLPKVEFFLTSSSVC